MDNFSLENLSQFSLDQKEMIQVRGGIKKKEVIAIDEHLDPVTNPTNGDGLWSPIIKENATATDS